MTAKYGFKVDQINLSHLPTVTTLRHTVFNQFVLPQRYYYFLALQIRPHCGIIQGCSTILF